MPPVSPIVSSAARARFVSGRTPIDRMTISAGTDCPFLKITFSPFPSLSKEATACSRYRFTPFSIKCWWTSEAMEKSMGAITWFPISTIETFAPCACRFSAISSPINPAPMTTALRGAWVLIYSLIRSVSATFLNVKIPFRSIPGRGGRTGEAPVEISSLS